MEKNKLFLGGVDFRFQAVVREGGAVEAGDEKHGRPILADEELPFTPVDASIDKIWPISSGSREHFLLRTDREIRLNSSACDTQ